MSPSLSLSLSLSLLLLPLLPGNSWIFGFIGPIFGKVKSEPVNLLAPIHIRKISTRASSVKALEASEEWHDCSRIQAIQMSYQSQ
jgi:hypothetical protein